MSDNKEVTNIRFLSLRDLEADKEGSSVWCLNNTNPRGTINISMPNGLGSTMVMTLPVTWIPVDLTTQATKESLLKSPDFRRMVTMGVIRLMAEHQAEKIMQEEDARIEGLRVYSNVNAPMDLATMNSNPDVVKIQKEESGAVSGFAMNVVGMDLEEAQILTMIRGQDGVLTKEDYSYMAANSAMSRVKEYCAAKATSIGA